MRQYRYRTTLFLLLATPLACVAVLSAAAQTEDRQYTAEAVLAGASLYTSNCQVCHGQNGDGIGGVNLARQQFKRVASDDDIRSTIHNGVVTAGMPAFPAFQEKDLTALVAFIRSGLDRAGTAQPGDVARGRSLFEGKGGCTECHHSRGGGPGAAPSLSNIGAIRLAAQIKSTILDPTGAMFPINRPVRIVTHDGATYRGRRLNEDTFSVLLVDTDNRLIALPKTSIREFEKSMTSSMPSYAGKFSEAELADLLAYLVSLKGH